MNRLNFDFEVFQVEKSSFDQNLSWFHKEAPIEFSEEISMVGFARTAAHAYTNEAAGEFDLFTHFSTFLTKARKDLGEHSQKKIEHFLKELKPLHDKSAIALKKKLQEDGVLLIPIVKQGETFLLRIENGVGLQLFSAATSGVDKVQVQQGYNPLTNNLQVDVKVPCELSFTPSNKKKFLEDPFFDILAEAIAKESVTKEDLILAIEQQISAKGCVRDLEEASYKKGFKALHGSEMKALSFAFQSAMVGRQELYDSKEGIQDYKILMFYFQMNVLISSWKKERAAASRETLTLFEDVSSNLARSAEKLHNKGFITDVILKEFMYTLLTVQNEIDSKKTEKKANTSSNDVCFEFEEATFLKATLDVEAPQIELVPKIGTGAKIPVLEEELTQFKTLWQPLEAETLSSQLESLCNALEKNAFPNVLSTQLEAFMTTFPSPKDKIWSKVSDEERVKVMESLNRLLTVLVKVPKPKSPLSHVYVSPKILVMSHQVLAIVDCLARQDKTIPFEKNEKLYISQFLSAVRSSRFFLEAPFQKKLNEVLDYFLGDDADSVSTLVKEKEEKNWTLTCNKAQKEHLFGLFSKKKINLDDSLRGSWVPFKKSDPTYRMYEKFVEKDKDHAVSTLSQVASLMMEGETKLPKTFFLLQQAAFKTYHFFSEEPKFIEKRDVSADYKGKEHFILTMNSNRLFYYKTNLKEVVTLKEKDDHLNINLLLEELDTHLQNYQSLSFLSKRVVQEFLDLSNDPFEEALRCVTFCQNHMGALKEPLIRSVIKAKLLRVNRLSNQLKAAAFEKPLKALIENGLIHFKESGDVEGCLFFVDLATVLAPFLEEKSSFVEGLRELFLQELLPFVRDNGFSGVAVLDKILKFYPEVTPYALACGKDIPESFLVDFILREILENQTNEKSQDTSDIKLFAAPYYHTVFEKSASGVLNKVASLLGYDNSARQWSLVNERYECKDLVFDFSTNRLLTKGGTEAVALPIVIKGDDLYKKVIGEEVVDNTVKLGDAFIVTTKSQKVFKFHKTDSSLRAEKLIDGQFASLETRTESLCLHYPTRLKSDMLFWRCDAKVFVYEKENHLLTLTLDTTSQVVSCVIEESGRHLKSADHFPNLVSELKVIESDLRNWECLCNDSSELKELNLAKSHLSFEKKGNRLESKEYPGFYLVKKQEIEGIPTTKNYVVLENKIGQKKILFNEFEKVVCLSYIDGELKAYDTLSFLSLARLYFEQSKWKEGEFALKMATGIKLYTKDELEHFKKLKTVLEKMNHPVALAPWLKLMVQVEENRLKYPPSVKSLEEAYNYSVNFSFDHYPMYLLCRGNMGVFAPDFREEKRFIELIQRRLKETLATKGMKPKSADAFASTLLAPFTHDHETFIEGKKVAQKCVIVPLSSIMRSLKNDNHRSVFLDHKVIDAKFGNYKESGFVFSTKSYFLTNKNDFNLRFVDYYKLAKEGSEEERKHLLKMIDLNTPLLNWDNREFASILRSVCKNPCRFPSIEKIAEGKKAAFKEKSLNFRQRVYNTWFGPKVKYQRLLAPLCIGKLHLLVERIKGIISLVSGYFSLIGVIFKVNYYPTFFSKKFKQIMFKPTGESELKIESAETLIAEENQSLKIDLKDLHVRIKKDKLRLTTRKTALITYLNQVSDKNPKKLVHKIGMQKRLGLHELKTLFLKASTDEFLKITDLSKEDGIVLLNGLARYFLELSQLQRLERANESFISGDLHKASSILEEKRSSIDSFEKVNRIHLLFESSQKIVYWDQQVSQIRDILNGLEKERDLLVKIDTGKGKTKVIIPDLVANLAGKKLVCLVWPESSEIRNTLEIGEQLKSTFGTGIERFDFDRNVDLSIDSLKLFYEELHRGLREGIPLNMRPESIRALQLHYQLLLDDFSEEDREKVHYLMLILRFFRTKSVAIVDEEHINFRPNDQLVYTNGKKSAVKTSHIDIVEDLFRAMNGSDVRDLIKHKENNQHLLDSNVYDEAVKPHLIKKMGDALNKTLQCEPKIDERELSEFVNNSREEMPLWVQSHPLKEEICLVKGYIHYLLKGILKGSVDKTYGLSKLNLKKSPYAIVYAGANTPKENEVSPSQFKVPEKTLAVTYLTYLHKGLNLDQFIEIIKLIQEDVRYELRNGGSIVNTEAFKFYKGLFKNKESTPSLLELKSTEDFSKIFEELSHNEELIYSFIRRLVIPELSLYKETFTSTAQNMRSQFLQTLSFSATPLDKNTHAKETLLIEERQVFENGKERLLKKVNKIHVFDVYESKKLLDAVKQLISSNDKLRMLIDVGALFKGKSNEEIAKDLIETVQQKGIVFFNEKDNRFHKLDKEKKSSLFDDKVLNKDASHFDYLDDMRSYGTDLKQAVDAMALVLLGEEITFAGAVQALGRLRSLDDGQSAEVALQKLVAEKIFNEGDSHQEKLEKLVNHLIIKQLLEDQQSNFEGKKQQLDNEIHSVFMDKLLGIDPLNPKFHEKGDISKAVSLFKKVRSEFVMEDPFDPTRYGSSSKELEAKEALNDHKKCHLKRVKKLKGLSKKEKEMLQKRIEGYSFEAMALPLKVQSFSAQQDVEIEVEQELSVELENKNESEHKNQSSFEIKRPWGHPNNLDLFKPGWEKPSRVFGSPLLNKISSVVGKIFAKIGIWLSPPPQSANFFRRLTYILAFTIFLEIIIGVAIAILIVTAPVLAPVILVYSGYKIYGAIKAFKNRATYQGREAPYRFDCPIYRVQDVLGSKMLPEVAQVKKFFSPNLLVTNNFWQLKLQSGDRKVHTPFSRGEKPLYSVLVIQDETKLQVMLIDQNDTEFFRKKLLEDREKGANKSLRKIAVYDLSLGMIVDQGVNPFDETQLKQDEAFISLIAQAKILSGETKNYDAFETKAIAKRLPFCGGVKVLCTVFEKHIISSKESNKFYKNSTIYKLLNG